MSDVDSIVKNASLFRGCRLISDPCMTDSKVVPIKRNRFMSIVAKIFKLRKNRVEIVPSRSVYLVHDAIVAHPEIVREIERAVKAQEKPCQLLQ